MSRNIYRQNYGEFQEDKIIRHKCDNPTCINPEHLEVGTRADNMMDRRDRGRTAVGENHGAVRLKERQVLEIKQNINVSMAHYARKFGVCHSTVKAIRNGITWRHI